MATVVIFLAAYFCVLNQFLSRNLIFILITVACILALIALEMSKRTKRWFCIVPSVALNLFMLPSTIGWHIDLQGKINDYAVCSVILILMSVLLVLDVLPTKRRKSKTPAGSAGVCFWRVSI